MSRLPFLILPLLFLLAGSVRAEAAPVDFNYDIRPIISAKCYHCHGPDESTRKAKLRLDLRTEALKEREGVRPIVPGDLKGSELVARITSHDSDEVMPPPKEGQPLSKGEIDLLQRWIAEGAEYKEHWAWIPPVRPALPAVGPVRNPIDALIRQRLQKAGLHLSPEADRPTLLRRLSLDLVGLPPTPEETVAFVQDAAPDYYERAVDRLLASPHFGEKWARMWLDLARYADSTGYGSDFMRLNIWPYRDWVIQAFNKNLPFDRFTTDQLAGDLLPQPAPEQLVATAFHRNTMTNVEGGTVREEYRVAAVKDRISTTAEVWMGLTMQCAQCHSHKFDPITQADYYQFFAIFNQTEDNDRSDEAPTLPLPTPDELAKQEKLQAAIVLLEKKLGETTPELEAERHEWEAKAAAPITWTTLGPSAAKASGTTQLTTQADGSVLASGGDGGPVTYTVAVHAPLHGVTAFRLEALPDDSLPGKGPGQAGNGNAVVTEIHVEEVLNDAASPRARYVRVEAPGPGRILSLAEVQAFRGADNLAQAGQATQSTTDYEGTADRAIDGKTDGDFFKGNSVTHTAKSDSPWWEVDLGSEQPIDRVVIWNRTDDGHSARLANTHVLLLDAARKPLRDLPIGANPGAKVELSLDGARHPIALQHATADFSQGGFDVTQAIDGNAGAKNGWAFLPQTGQAHAAVFEAVKPVGEGTLAFTIEQNFGDRHTLGHFRLQATDALLPVREIPPAIRAVLALEPSERTPEQRQQLDAYYRPLSPILVAIEKDLKARRDELAAIKPVAVPVMRELVENKRRESHLLNKGNYLSPAQVVQPALPVAFAAGVPAEAKPDRLAVARWILAPENPLTARVAVNRFWSQLFGTGIVETEEDFGTQGALPSHPELLDWLAVTFRSPASTDPAQPGLAWDMKALLKLIVNSDTYRQSSRSLPEHLEKDARNRLLARYPRRRLEAELVRDQALALSGLLTGKIGGPSVYPPQPDGLWRVAFNGRQNTYQTSIGEDRYRRGLYTIWRRTAPYPSMATFDAPSRESCTLRRLPTNTPLQAFVTLNDPCFVECAQALARRIVKEGGSDTPARLKWALTLVLGHPPTEAQIGILEKLLNTELETYRADDAAAVKLASSETQPLPKDADAPELAAWTVLANVLLNLDGVLTKG